MNTNMNGMGQQRPAGSLGFPRMGPTQSPPVMAPGAAPPPAPAQAPAANTGIVPPAPMPAAPAVPQNVPVSVVTAGEAPPAAPAVMPANPVAAAAVSGHNGAAHLPGFARQMPGMADLLQQYFANGGDRHGLFQQMRGARQEYAAGDHQGSIMRDAKNGGTGLIDYLRAHLMPPATGGA
jgi:hypothetical protein